MNFLVFLEFSTSAASYIGASQTFLVFILSCDSLRLTASTTEVQLRRNRRHSSKLYSANDRWNYEKRSLCVYAVLARLSNDATSSSTSEKDASTGKGRTIAEHRTDVAGDRQASKEDNRECVHTYVVGWYALLVPYHGRAVPRSYQSHFSRAIFLHGSVQGLFACRVSRSPRVPGFSHLSPFSLDEPGFPRRVAGPRWNIKIIRILAGEVAREVVSLVSPRIVATTRL